MGRVSKIKKPKKKDIWIDTQIEGYPTKDYKNIIYNQGLRKMDKFRKQELNELADELNIEALLMNIEVSILRNPLTASDSGILLALSRKAVAKLISAMIKEKL